MFKRLTLILLFFCSSVLAHDSTQSISPNLITINNIELVYEVSAKRDYGPVTRNDASGVIIQLDVYSKSRERVHGSITVTQALAMFENENWNLLDSKDQQTMTYFDRTGYSFIFRQGPSWPIEANIKLNVSILIDGINYRLNSLMAKIIKTS